MRRTKIMWTAVAVVAAVGLFFAGLATGVGMGSRIISGNFSDGFDSAKSLLDKTGLLPQTPGKITTIGGTITAINNNKITIAVSRVTPNPLEDQGPESRTINISDKTTIVAMVPLSVSEMANANSLFLADVKDGKPANPPAPFKEQAGNVSDLKVGMQIAVTAADNIKDAATIDAVKISFQGTVSASAPASAPAPVTPPKKK